MKYEFDYTLYNRWGTRNYPSIKVYGNFLGLYVKKRQNTIRVFFYIANHSYVINKKGIVLNHRSNFRVEYTPMDYKRWEPGQFII